MDPCKMGCTTRHWDYPYRSIPMRMLADSWLSDSAKVVFGVLLRYQDRGMVEPLCYRTIAVESGGRSHRVIDRSMRELFESGWLDPDRGDGVPEYTLHVGSFSRAADMDDPKGIRRGGVRITDTHQMIHALIERDGSACRYCGTDLACFCAPHEPQAFADHVIPRSKYGEDFIANRVLACRHCNTSKADRSLDEWYGKRIAYVLMAAFTSWNPSRRSLVGLDGKPDP